MTGADRFAAALRASGVTTIFSVSGNQILALYESAASAGLRIVHMRHESAAAYAAAGWAEVRGEPGVVLVAGGPGFLASLTGVGVAAAMESPLVLVSGGPPASGDRPGAFQYLDQATIAGTVCKRTQKIASADAIEPGVAQAFGAAAEGVTGPVHLMLPVDVATCEAGEAKRHVAGAPPATALGREEEEALRAIAAALAEAERPVLIARPSANRGAAGEALRELSTRLGVPPVVMESPRGSEDLKYRAITARYPEADYALVVGPADFSVHFLAPEKIARDGRVALIDAEGDPHPPRALDAHLRLAPARALAEIARRIPQERRAPWIEIGALDEPQPLAGALHPFVVGKLLRESLAPNDLVVLDGGEFGQWVRLALAACENHVVWNSRFGAIGGSIPLALGAAIAQPERRVVAVTGDGAFGYHGAEIETAVREGARLTIVVGNDDRWGAEWHAQRQKYGRAVATMLGTVCYDEVARGLGAQGYEADDESSLRRALALAAAADEAVCVNVRIASVRSPATAP
jgi:acetolactate synthase-1/2/3 large subunit